MQIAGYIKTSLIEWPGKITSVIFTPGCNFRCPFCHNADLVGNRGLTLMPEKQILADLKERKKWVDAVVITGGEPTLQEDLPDFLKKLGELGFLRMIHTNGTKPEAIASLLHCSMVDYVCMDLKGDLGNYEKFTNVQLPITNVERSLRTIIGSGVEYELRTTVVPGLHTEDNLLKLAKELKTIFGDNKLIENCRWFLQQFRPMNTLDKKFMKVEPFSKEKMESFQKELQKIILQIKTRGI